MGWAVEVEIVVRVKVGWGLYRVGNGPGEFGVRLEVEVVVVVAWVLRMCCMRVRQVGRNRMVLLVGQVRGRSLSARWRCWLKQLGVARVG